MNVERGFKRITWLFIALVWVVTIIACASQDDPGRALGQATIYLPLFTLVVLGIFRAITWAVRGFRDDAKG